MPFSNREERIAYRREYYRRNREELLAHNREYRLNNRDALKAQDRERYARNRDAKLSWQREYYRQHQEKRLAWHRAYRLKNRSALAAARKTNEARLALAERQARRRTARSPLADEAKIREFYTVARDRTKATGIKHVVDHIVPIQHPLVCGLHNEYNLRVITQIENARKNNSYTPEWVRA